MVGEVIQTQYFAPYLECRDTDKPAEAIVGRVHKEFYLDRDAAYLYTPEGVKYDLPRFMLQFEGRRVAILGRKYDKYVNGKAYHKLVVIKARALYDKVVARPMRYSDYKTSRQNG